MCICREILIARAISKLCHLQQNFILQQMTQLALLAVGNGRFSPKSKIGMCFYM